MGAISKRRILHQLIVMLMCMSGVAQAIVIRHDRADASYQALAQDYRPSLAYLDRCAATVLSNYWLITAAHCVSPSNHYPVSISHLGRKYPVKQILVHPEAHKLDDIDVALLQLNWPLQDAKPVAVYAADDELGEHVVFVGKGKTGHGAIGEQIFDGIERAATNTVVAVEPYWLSFKFDAQLQATELEGVSGTEDSGGPAFVRVNGQLQLMAVGCCQEPATNEQGVEVQGLYGSTEHYTRLSPLAPWITQTIATPPLTQPATSDAAVATIKKALAEHDLQHAATLIKQSDLSELSAAASEQLLLNCFYHASELVPLLLAEYPQLQRFRLNTLPLTVYAYMQGNGPLLSQLIELDIGLNHSGFRDQQLPALLSWQYFGDDYPQQIALLQAKGLDINRRDERGDTAVHMAGYLGYAGRITALVKLGANIDSQNTLGNTALMDALRRGNGDIVTELVALGAKTQLKNNDGLTAHELAAKHGLSQLLLGNYQDLENEDNHAPKGNAKNNNYAETDSHEKKASVAEYEIFTLFAAGFGEL